MTKATAENPVILGSEGSGTVSRCSFHGCGWEACFVDDDDDEGIVDREKWSWCHSCDYCDLFQGRSGCQFSTVSFTTSLYSLLCLLWLMFLWSSCRWHC